MRYDFTKVQAVIDRRGLTLAEVSDLTKSDEELKRPLHYTTIGKALESGRSSQKTAKALAKALRIPFTKIVIPREAA